MSTPLQKPKKPRTQGVSGTPATGMLDAYVDQQVQNPATHDDGKPVSKKNKNKKKREQREAEEKRRQSESNSQHPDDDEDEVIDSWESISAADAPQLPKTAIKIETPPKKPDVQSPTIKTESTPSPTNKVETKSADQSKGGAPSSKKNDKGNKNQGKGGNADNKKPDRDVVEKMAELSISANVKTLSSDIAMKALTDLLSTMDTVSVLFKTPLPVPQKAPIKEVSSVDGNKPVLEKSREEIQAEREAKKQAKTAVKQGNTKQTKTQTEETSKPSETEETSAKMEVDSEEKSREEIKAEREAKKLAKAAAKQGIKVKPAGDDKAKPADEAEQAGGKSKAELKAERRAKQEAQRAAKEQQLKSQPANVSTAAKPDPAKAKPAGQPAPVAPAKSGPTKSQRVSDDIQADRPSVEKKRQRMLAAQQIPPRTKAQKKVLLFKHLHQYERELSVTRPYPIVGAHIHPSVLQLGLQYSEGTIQGSNARCVALLHTLKKVIMEYETPEEKEFSRDLDAKLKLYISFLKECRPHSVSMGNAIRTIKSKITSLESGISDSEAKEILCDTIDLFCRNVELAPESIAKTACEKIRDGDVILTYGCSSLLKFVLIKAWELGRKFRVIVADSRPKLEGREMARHMVNAGIHCTYLHISAIAHTIKEVTKVFLGAHAVLANGFVMSRVGTSQISLIAKANNVPVMVCCETYKFSERVQTDSFVFNELGDPDDLVATGTKSNPLEDWRDLKHLCLLNLTYDFTPANLVDAIISEISVIPCTSVPVVLRLKKDDIN